MALAAVAALLAACGSAPITPPVAKVPGASESVPAVNPPVQPERRQARIGLALAQRVAARHLSSTGLEGLADGLHVGLCGAGSKSKSMRNCENCVKKI